LSTVEAKLVEQSLVIISLSDSILDLTRRLEIVEDDDDDDDEVYVRPDDQKEDWVAYLQRMEIEDHDRWIQLISEGEPSGSTPSTSSWINEKMGSLLAAHGSEPFKHME